jgi:epothilone polyketide synthase D
VGVGCRFPGGVDGPQSFWQLLEDGIDATRDVPLERWDAEALYDPDPDAPGKSYVKRGGFLDHIDGFDAEFFGISPREASGLDPQQRLLLEVTWEALEDAGIVADSLRGSATGVWVGFSLDDYARRNLSSGDYSRIDAYTALGNARSVAAGRISYVLGLHGPTLQLDTSCSSSLVTVHLAVQSLRSGESDLALVGGVNLMTAPEPTIALCKLRALSTDGRCKTFDVSADGYARGEGCGMVVLKRLSDALSSNDRIVALIRGSAVNHDGRSNGLTAPNGAAQDAVIRAALQAAGLDAGAIDYVEAHGTGTPLGDPIEVLSLNRVYCGQRSPDAPLYLGSVKTNIGHLEGAAGVAGLIKTALCLSHGRMVQHLHFKEPNPSVPWERLPIRVVGQARDWTDRDGSRRAGLSSFGISGTNAHIILERAPSTPPVAPAPQRAAELVVLSARSREALDAVMTRLGDHVERYPELRIGDIAHDLLARRALLPHRRALAVTSRAELRAKLADPAMRSIGAAPVGAPPRAAWLFTGQGAQRLGMGRGLHEEWPAFRAAFDEACQEFDALLGRSLRDVIWAAPDSQDAGLLDKTAYTQPALFAFEWALAALWSSWGVKPEWVAGHSIGEVVAACFAGLFSLPDACRLVAARGGLMQALPSGGAMCSIAATAERVGRAVAPHEGSVSIAAINAPTSVVVSGEREPIEVIVEQLEREGIHCQALNVSHAFHSPLMEPMLEKFRAVASSIQYRRPSIPLISNSSGALAGTEVETADYWVRHVRDAVRFADGVRALRQAGADAFLEVGPRGTLLGLVGEVLAGESFLSVPPLRSSLPEPVAALSSLGAWIEGGGGTSVAGLFPSGGRRCGLPTYAWHRKRYWIENSPEQTPAALEAALQELPRDRLSSAARAALPEILALLRERGDRSPAPDARLAYDIEWRPVAAPPRRPSKGVWLVFGDAEGASAMREAARRVGADVRANPSLDALSTAAERRDVRGVLYFVDKAPGYEGRVLTFQQWASLQPTPLRVWWFTSGAVAVDANVVPQEPAQAVVWGLARAFAVERPEAHGGVLDVLDGSWSEELANLAMRAILDAREDQLALRATGVWVPRIVPLRLPKTEWKPAGAGTALITGGLGALGSRLAHWLVDRGVADLLLTSRRGASTPGAAELVSALRARGARVTVAAAESSDRDALRDALTSVALASPLRWVFHTAGVSDVTALAELTSSRLQQVLQAKVSGTVVLDELTRELPVEMFVCFSSIAGVLGSSAAYAAANAYLDAWSLAATQHRRVCSIAWGPWGGGGMASSLASRFERVGVRSLEPSVALGLLGQALSSSRSFLIAADVDWARLRSWFELSGHRPLFAELPSRAEEASVPPPSPRVSIQALSATERIEHVRSLVLSKVAQTLGVTGTVATDVPLIDLGFDSLMLVELRRAVARDTGVELPVSLAIERPTAAAVIEQVVSRLPSPSVRPPSVRPTAAVVRGECLKRVAAPKSRIFCFHEAGGAPEGFAPFVRLTDEAGVEVHTISHVRGAASRERSAEFVAGAASYIRSLTDRPYVIFGQSIGALLGWAVANELSSSTERGPRLMVVSSAFSPAQLTELLSRASIDELFTRIVGSGSAVGSQARRDFAEDLELWTRLPASAYRSAPVPIEAFVGRDDHIIDEVAISRWSQYTTRGFALRVLQGDHFYLRDRRAMAELMDEIVPLLG